MLDANIQLCEFKLKQYEKGKDAMAEIKFKLDEGKEQTDRVAASYFKRRSILHSSKKRNKTA